MTPLPHLDTDPLPQLLADHPGFGGAMVVASQIDAVAQWPRIARHDGEVVIVLRRVGQEEVAEWRDMLVVLRHLLSTVRRPIGLRALSEEAAASLTAELDMPVDVAPALPRLYSGHRHLELCRVDGALHLRTEAGDLHPARQYNLARLRRVARIEADAGDPDLSDLAGFANGAGAITAAPTRPPVVIIVVPNGTGLGHVTRMLAVARQLTAQTGARVIFWSFSRAAGIIDRFGFETVLRQTARHLGADPDHWLTWETEEFAAALQHLQPDLVVQDASLLQDFVVDAMARPQAGTARLVLIRRGMWQPNILGTDPLTSEQLADAVIEPGDLAGAADRGITRGRFAKTDCFAQMSRTAPVTLTRPDAVMSRRAARRALQLGRGRHCLMSLGGDDLWDWTPVLRKIVEAAQKEGIRLVWARSPLAPPVPGLSDIITRSVYPLAPYLAAFDGVVSTAGYNSFHELMQLYVGPVLLVPRQHSQLDDQTARAQFAAAQGWARYLPDSAEGPAVLAAFLADLRARQTVTTRPAWQDGASEMAQALAAVLEPGGSHDI